MYLSRLSLTDFRSYESVEIELPPGGSAFVGPNGQGKTNLIEAICYLSSLSSHRVGHDAPLVRVGADRAVIRGHVVRDERSLLLEIEITPGRTNRARVNRAPIPRPREILGLLRTVLFAPEDLALVKGDPGERRRFLDELLALRTPRLAGVRADYDRVLKQRNALLKSAGAARRAGQTDLRTLDVWDAHLASAGAELLAARLEIIDQLRPFVAKAYDTVAGGQGEVRLDYRSSLGQDTELIADRRLLDAALLEAMGRARRDELERGVSLVGPHRDDLMLRLGGLPARGYASHGESWSYALALRLASYELLTQSEAGRSGEPLLILDDVFAELDDERRDRLAKLVAPAQQVLVSAAVPADVPENLAGARFDVMEGSVRRVR